MNKRSPLTKIYAMDVCIVLILDLGWGSIVITMKFENLVNGIQF